MILKLTDKNVNAYRKYNVYKINKISILNKLTLCIKIKKILTNCNKKLNRDNLEYGKKKCLLI